MAENVEMSKSARKNKKRAEKREKARLQNKLAEDVENIVELKDPISVLRDELQEAKLNKNHKLAAELRQQIWVVQDQVAGYIPNIESTDVQSSSPSSRPVAVAQGEQIVPLTPTDKRLKTLRKKIQQIQTLKNKKENGEVLEATQIEKISSEQEILEEITELEKVLAQVRL